MAPLTSRKGTSPEATAPGEIAIMVKYASGHALFLTASRLATVAKVRQAFRQQTGMRRKKGRFRMVGDYAMQDNETLGYVSVRCLVLRRAVLHQEWRAELCA